MAGERQVDYPQLGEARIVRIFSNQYFLPLFYLNPHHREQLRVWMRTSSANNISSTSSGSGRLLSSKTKDGGAQRVRRPLTVASAEYDATAGLFSPIIHTLLRPQRRLQTRIEELATKIGLRGHVGDGGGGVKVLSMHMRCMKTLNGGCSPKQIQAYATCAASRLEANNASGLFIATMHLRDREYFTKRLKEAMHPRPIVVSHADGITAEKVQSGVKEQEDTRLVDTWLVGRGHEVLLSPQSTMGYLAAALADRSSAITMVDTCMPPPSREACFHVLAKAYKRSAHCKAEAEALKMKADAAWAGLSARHSGHVCAW